MHIFRIRYHIFLFYLPIYLGSSTHLYFPFFFLCICVFKLESVAIFLLPLRDTSVSAGQTFIKFTFEVYLQVGIYF